MDDSEIVMRSALAPSVGGCLAHRIILRRQPTRHQVVSFATFVQYEQEDGHVTHAYGDYDMDLQEAKRNYYRRCKEHNVFPEETV